MWGPVERLRYRMNWPLALLVGVGASVLYTAIVLGYTVLPFSGIGIGDPVWLTVGVSGLTSLGVIGVPVVLWGRYRLRTPLACMALILLFWHVLVEFPPIGSGQGDSPGFLFVFVLAPIYVIVYAILAGVERRFRSGDRRKAYSRV